MKKNRLFWRKPWGWVTLFLGLTLVQMLSLLGVDQFLRAPSLAAVAAVQTEQNEIVKPEVPADALQSIFSVDNQYAAYTNSDNELVILKGTEESFRKKVGNVTYMKWLGESNALVYFVGEDHLVGYLLHVDGSKPTKIYSWYGTKREVAGTYFSPYMEFLYIEIQNGEHTEVYKFDAVDGISQLPLGNVQIQDIQYDDKSDIMRLTTPEGEVWRYEEDRLYRPDGSEVKQSQPVHHHPANNQEYSNKK